MSKTSDAERAFSAIFAKPETQEAIRASEEADKLVRRTQMAADAMALKLMASRECPDDLRQWAKNHGIPNFAEVTWQAGFVQGWRAAILHHVHGDKEGEQ